MIRTEGLEHNEDKMTRNNNSKSTYSSSHSTLISPDTNDDNFINLPDLSGIKDDEKQHILNVLLRDENLRNKHLSRFMQLKKEVADLEQKPQSTSTSVCARCQTSFGLIFNTGDTCPKCGAKVCKQCRLLYNFNDQGWVCQLCYKQMQLLSYSGEWIYTQPTNLRKNSVTASEIIRKSLSPPVSIRNSNGLSSSDTETEDTPNPSNRNRISSQRSKSNHQNSNHNINPMVIQTTTDEEKLNTIKQNAKKRPYQVPPSPQTRQFPSTSTLQRGASSDDVDSLYERSTINSDRGSPPSIHMDINEQHQGRNSAIPKITESSSTIHSHTDYTHNNNNNRLDDCASVTSSEWGLESERGDLSTLQQSNASIKSNSKHSLSSRMHLTGSIQSIRDAAHRFPKPHLSGSRTSLNSERKSVSEISDTQSKSSMYPTWSSG